MHCWDGAIRSALERHARQRHAAYDEVLQTEYDELVQATAAFSNDGHADT